MKLKDALQPGRPTVLEQLLASSLPTVIYGAGYCARSLSDALIAEGKPAVCCTVDRQWMNGVYRCAELPLVPLDELHQRITKCNIAVAIGTARPNWDLLKGVQGVNQVFGNVGMARGLPMTRDFVENHTDKLNQTINSLGDDASRVAFGEYLQSRLFGHTDDIPKSHHPQGWFTSTPLTLTNKEVFCDCGAYDGDTIARFLQATEEFEHIYAWEPDPMNAAKLAECLINFGIRRYSIFRQCAASYRGEIRFSNESAAVSAISSTGAIVVPCDTIDSLCPDITLLKADVEGAELDVLRGAKQTMETRKPKIVVAAYHRREDCFEIQQYIASVVEDRASYFRWMRDCPDDVLFYSV